MVVLYADSIAVAPMSYILNDTALRSSLPQEQWRRAADAAERKRLAVAAASRRRAQVQQQTQQREHEAAANAVARTAEAQLATLRSEFDALREAMLQHFISEFEELRRELRLDAERQLKHIATLNISSQICACREFVVRTANSRFICSMMSARAMVTLISRKKTSLAFCPVQTGNYSAWSAKRVRTVRAALLAQEAPRARAARISSRGA